MRGNSDLFAARRRGDGGGEVMGRITCQPAASPSRHGAITSQPRERSHWRRNGRWASGAAFTVCRRRKKKGGGPALSLIRRFWSTEQAPTRTCSRKKNRPAPPRPPWATTRPPPSPWAGRYTRVRWAGRGGGMGATPRPGPGIALVEGGGAAGANRFRPKCNLTPPKKTPLHRHPPQSATTWWSSRTRPRGGLL